MDIALCNEVLRAFPLKQQCEVAARLGYDSLELAPFTLGAEPHRLGIAERRSLRQLITDAGLGVVGLHWLLVSPPGLSITSADPDIRASTLEVLRGLVLLCAELGGRVLIHGSPEQRRTLPGDDPSEARKRAVEAIVLAAEHAAEAGLVYCLEALPPASTNFVNTIYEAVEIVNAVSSPALRTMIDTCAAAAAETESIPGLIERWVPTGLIGHVQLNDSSGCGPGQGNDDFVPVLRALVRTGYAHSVSIEPFIYEPDGPTCAARAIRYVRGILESLRG
ncbi:MAG: sugar phosphate isomerase/epimerase family protein [Dongiaceae bacterium]